MEIQRNDVVRGWFGTAVVTDVAYGFLTHHVTDEQISPVDDMVRVEFDRGGSTYVYRSDIKEIL